MTRVRTRGEEIRRFIIDNVQKHPADISRVASVHFGISRQAVSRHLRLMVKEGVLFAEGETRGRRYRLQYLTEWRHTYALHDAPAEHEVWRSDVLPVLGEVPENIRDIWQYGFTEMFNNVLDHSDGESVTVMLRRTAAATEMVISDDGVGIFRKIQAALGLDDERHSVLELAKGKLTTDPENHTGEGIFFTSRMFDDFDILSGGVFFSHKFGEQEDWIQQTNRRANGTFVWMKLSNHTARTAKRIFDSFATGDDFGFTKTVVPVRLAQYGDDKLVSRSQAKRLLSRVDRFKVVGLDFAEVESIGQAFADEVFRVFARQHPEVEIVPIHMRSAVKRMVMRAKGS